MSTGYVPKFMERLKARGILLPLPLGEAGERSEPGEGRIGATRSQRERDFLTGMTTFLTILIFTLATAAAAEISIWGPEAARSPGDRQSPPRSAVSAGPRTGSLLRQQPLGAHRLEITKTLQAMIDQARLPYRAGNVLTLARCSSREATSFGPASTFPVLHS